MKQKLHIKKTGNKRKEKNKKKKTFTSIVITYQRTHDTDELQIAFGWQDHNFHGAKKNIKKSFKV